MASPTNTTARTEESPVEKLAQCKLTREKPLFDWSREMWSEESVISVSLGVDGGGFSDITDGLAMFLDVLLDELLFMYLVDEVLAIAEQKGCHCCVGVEEVKELVVGEVLVIDNCT